MENVIVFFYIEIEVNFYMVFMGMVWYGVLQIIGCQFGEFYIELIGFQYIWYEVFIDGVMVIGEVIV